MTILGNDFAIILRVTVPESQTADKIAELVRTAFPEFVVSARATTTHPIFTSPVRIFSVAVEGPDQPGIVQILTKMFLDHKGSVRDLDTDTSSAPFAGYKIFSLKSVVALPINVSDTTQSQKRAMRSVLFKPCTDFSLSSLILFPAFLFHSTRLTSRSSRSRCTSSRMSMDSMSMSTR